MECSAANFPVFSRICRAPVLRVGVGRDKALRNSSSHAVGNDGNPREEFDRDVGLISIIRSVTTTTARDSGTFADANRSDAFRAVRNFLRLARIFVKRQSSTRLSPLGGSPANRRQFDNGNVPVRRELANYRPSFPYTFRSSIGQRRVDDYREWIEFSDSRYCCRRNVRRV